MNDLCLQRLFTARLLRQVLDASPRVVVLDKFYSSRVCPQGDAGTADLDAAIGAYDQIGTPVVIAVQRATNARGPLAFVGQRTAPEQIDFARTRKLVRYGNAHLDYDLNRVPLRWGLDPDQPARFPEIVTRTLALEAALSTGERPPDVLTDMIGRGVNPLTDLLPPSRFVRVSALSLVCDIKQREEWLNCENVTPADRLMLRGMVVIIGNDDAEDVMDKYTTTAGEMSGVFLHANYIESLLDYRWYSPLNVFVAIAIGGVMFLSVEFMFRKAGPEMALLTSAVFLSLVEFVILRQGFYMTLWIPIIPALLMRYGATYWRRPRL